MRKQSTYDQKLRAMLKAIENRGIKTAEKILRQEIKELEDKIEERGVK